LVRDDKVTEYSPGRHLAVFDTVVVIHTEELVIRTRPGSESLTLIRLIFDALTDAGQQERPILPSSTLDHAMVPPGRINAVGRFNQQAHAAGISVVGITASLEIAVLVVVRECRADRQHCLMMYQAGAARL